VNFQIAQLSTVPTQISRAARPLAWWPRSQPTLVAANSGSSGGPVRAMTPGCAFGLQLVAGRGRATALPGDDRTERRAGATVPDQDRTALVRDADGRNLHVRSLDKAAGNRCHRGLPDLFGGCCTQTGCGWVICTGLEPVARIAPLCAKSTALLLVVPSSMAGITRVVMPGTSGS